MAKPSQNIQVYDTMKVSFSSFSSEILPSEVDEKSWVQKKKTPRDQIYVEMVC